MAETDIQATEAAEAAEDTAAGEPVTEDVLVEEISIDGMCGVY